jgi:hypothetical protein
VFVGFVATRGATDFEQLIYFGAAVFGVFGGETARQTEEIYRQTAASRADDQVIRENPANRGTSAEFLDGPVWRMESKIDRQPRISQ